MGLTLLSLFYIINKIKLKEFTMSEQVKSNIFSVSNDNGILSETTEVKVEAKSRLDENWLYMQALTYISERTEDLPYLEEFRSHIHEAIISLGVKSAFHQKELDNVKNVSETFTLTKRRVDDVE
jgi:hypothetical protein